VIAVVGHLLPLRGHGLNDVFVLCGQLRVADAAGDLHEGAEGFDGLDGEVGVVGEVAGEVVGGELILGIEAFGG
jgi:hypothetical protein